MAPIAAVTGSPIQEATWIKIDTFFIKETFLKLGAA